MSHEYKIDYEIEITNQYGGTDYYIQTAVSKEEAIDLFRYYFNEPCIIRRIWNPKTETRNEVKEICIKHTHWKRPGVDI